MKKCEKYQRWMWLKLYDELDEEQQNELSKHLHGCTDCVLDFEEINETKKLLDNKIQQKPTALMKIALFIGRFQPFHLGHLAVINRLARDYDLVKIVIGSSQCSKERDNPFSFEERKEMITRSVAVKNYKIYAVPDCKSDAEWIKHVEELAGGFDAVVSGNGLTRKLFRKAGYRVKRPGKRYMMMP